MKIKLNHTWNCEAELIDIFTPGTPPNPVSVDEYLGSKASVSFRKGLFKETQLVFKTAKGAYVVMPDTSGNKWLWSML